MQRRWGLWQEWHALQHGSHAVTSVLHGGNAMSLTETPFV